jgi:hypothetical protein
MINILDDDNEVTQYDDQEMEHGAGYDPNHIRGKMIKLKPEREEMIKAEFDCVVVNEFGDEYHLSEEERIAKNKFYEAFKSFSKCKHKYRKLDEFVDAMREALRCLEFVANNNGVYPPDKFKSLFFKDKIYITGLNFPEFKGRDRKNISWEYLSEFILSDRPSKEIVPNDDNLIMSSEELDELTEKLFTEEELKMIMTPNTAEEEYQEQLIIDVDELDQKDENIVVELSRKENKKFIQNQPEFLYEMKEIKRANNRIDKLASGVNRFVYDLTSDDIESIKEYDQQHGYYSESDMPEFHGDIMNGEDYHRYLMELEEWERTQVKIPYNGKLKTQEEIDSIELRTFLEQHGWNVRNMYGNKEREEKLKRIQKRDKKREKEIRKQLIRVQERRKRHMGEDIDSSSNKKSKKKKKKEKTKKQSNEDSSLFGKR